MPAKTNIHRRGVLNVLRGHDLKAPKAVYLGLMAELPSKKNPAGRELGSIGYERQQLTFHEPDEDGEQMLSSTIVLFPVAQEDWERAVGAGIFWTESGGVPRYAGAMDPVTVLRNQQLKFDVGDVLIQEL